MSENVKPIPEGYSSITPFYVSNDTEGLLNFLEKAFGAKTLGKIPMPDGKGIAHAVSQIGNSRIMLADASEQADNRESNTRSNTYLYVDDPDAVIENAEAAGAKVLKPAADMFWGDRWGLIEDPFGNRWQVAVHQKDVRSEDLPELMASSATG